MEKRASAIPVQRQIDHFLVCIQQQKEPVTAGSAGLAGRSQSMAQRDRPVQLRLTTLEATT